jgi:exonuclease III
MIRRKQRRAAQLVAAECLRQITLPGYQRKFTKIPDNKSNISWGNHLSETKGRTHCRILFINVNGLNHKNNYAKLFEIGEEAVYNDIDIVCMVETKQNWQNKHARRSCECISKRYFNQAKFITSSAVTPDDGLYLPGGTATIVGDPFNSRICKETSDDALGRWTAITLKGKQERKITIINAYQVNKDSVQSTDDRSTWKQQYNALRLTGVDNPDPCQTFWSDLEKYIKTLTNDKQEVLLMLDANDPHAKELNPIMQRLKMKDLHIHLHGTDFEPETHQRGTAQIDFMYGTAKVIEACTKAGIGAYDDICYTDHRHLFVDIDLGWLLSGYPPDLTRHENRMLETTNPNATKIYKESLQKYIERDQIHARMLRIRDRIAITHQLTEEDKEELEELDFLLTSAHLEAERQCGKLSNTPWSPKLKAANKLKRHWEMWCKQIKTGRDLSIQQKRINAEVGPHDPDNPTEEQAHQLLKEARKHLKEVKLKAKELREEFLIQRAETYMKLGKMSKAKKVKIILKAEARRKAFNNLKYIQGK